MDAETAEVLKLTVAIRRSFQRLRRVANGLHADLAISASKRAILEDLCSNGPRTVPQIAASKDVSRQHVQKIVDALLNQECVSLVPNPEHQRSPFVDLTGTGRATFAEIRKREIHLLHRLSKAMDPPSVMAAASTLHHLLVSLEPFIKGEDDDKDPDTD